MGVPIVQLENLNKTYGSFIAVNNLNLQIEHGEFLTLLGPSGCGKTTTLRMIGGFETPTGGSIYVNGQDVKHLPPFKRDINTVFQSYALFPHMTLFENVTYGLKMRKVPKVEREQQALEALRRVQLEHLKDHKPRQLSGGQQQRVALARALVNNPRVLLLDEPLGALDLKLRKEMQVELKHLHQQLGMTFIYVTHDQEEALTMSDRVAVMNGGNIEQLSTPEELYEVPQTRFVADFIGDTNLYAGGVLGVEGDSVILNLFNQRVHVQKKQASVTPEQKVYLSIRPERIRCSAQTDGEVADNQLTGIFEERVYVGSFVRQIIRVCESDERITVLETAHQCQHFTPGERVAISWEGAHGVLLPA
ncbi:polyamine ABC transporter ATP-binding protein [Brevibacillus fluminis]|uniref:Spermidine/putrescine import ATP-binding protein PotA n=1 Tax=Brevibacillus fluminis TaxID=511487 RepID=A0A3M8DPF9_9BACL|nr:polyamine ABC transporter ATP-binding protein [Brevibacillus fluminis]